MEPLVEIRESKTHGRGVFAKEDIKEGAKLCFYEGPVKKNEDITEEESHSIYLLHHPNKKDHVILGLEHPTDPFGIASIINDSMMPIFDFYELPHKTIFNKFRSEALNYRYHSNLNRNVSFVKFDGKIVDTWVYALRDIKKDEELFLRYDINYWVCFYMQKKMNAFYLLALLQLMNPPKIKAIEDITDKTAELFDSLLSQFQTTPPMSKKELLIKLCTDFNLCHG